MKKFAKLMLSFGTMLVFAIGLWAADFWQAKLFTDWTDKEIQKLNADSPWAKQVTISMGGGGGGGGDTGGKSGKGGKGGGGSANTLADDIAPGGGMGGGIAVNLTVRWQTALPVRQALVRMKYGAESGTSSEAKKVLDTDPPDYILVISGLNRGIVRGDPEQIKQAMMGSAQIVIKGKEPIKPKDFMLAGQGRLDAMFAFPKTNPILEDDKEVEFQCKVGTYTVKQKFRLKDMLFNGKLEL